jgi:hypothetical protein
VIVGRDKNLILLMKDLRYLSCYMVTFCYKVFMVGLFIMGFFYIIVYLMLQTIYILNSKYKETFTSVVSEVIANLAIAGSQNFQLENH